MIRRTPDAPTAPAHRTPRAGAFLSFVLLLGCGPSPRASPAASGSPESGRLSAPPPASAQEADAFRRRALAELGKPGAEDAPEARASLEALPPATRRTVALAVAADPDLRLSAIGIDRLVSDGFADDAVPALAGRVAGGDDLT